MENIGHKYQESEARVHSKFDNIVPSICYPLGDTVILCLADIEADTQYEIIKYALKDLVSIQFDDSQRKIQTRFGSWRFVTHDALKQNHLSFSKYILSAKALENLSIEEIEQARSSMKLSFKKEVNDEKRLSNWSKS